MDVLEVSVAEGGGSGDGGMPGKEIFMDGIFIVRYESIESKPGQCYCQATAKDQLATAKDQLATAKDHQPPPITN
ncbi:hypothetical protein N7523_010096 [Penicillium sp. IBT 18751x]|nr:hypothetical protein N7523_010096 [Penicillium sp. IBT 18751x]